MSNSLVSKNLILEFEGWILVWLVYDIPLKLKSGGYRFIFSDSVFGLLWICCLYPVNSSALDSDPDADLQVSGGHSGDADGDSGVV